MPTADQTTPDTTGPVIVSLICGASRSEETIKIDRARWDAMTPTERADLLDEEVDTLIGNAGGAGWHIANPDDEAAVGETTSVHRLQADLEQARADRDRAQATLADLRQRITSRTQVPCTLCPRVPVFDTADQFVQHVVTDHAPPPASVPPHAQGDPISVLAEVLHAAQCACRGTWRDHPVEIRGDAGDLAGIAVEAMRAAGLLAGDTTPPDGEVIRLDSDDDIWRQTSDGRWQTRGYTPMPLDRLERWVGPTELVRLVPVPAEPTSPATAGPDPVAEMIAAGIPIVEIDPAEIAEELEAISRHSARLQEAESGRCPGDPWCRDGHRCAPHRPAATREAGQ